jgi:ubiquinone/menaquinone biosynthesis C-methylase UbiE
MERREYETSYRLEDTYWWYVGQRRLLERFLKDNYLGSEGRRFLDVGCGTGRNLDTLQRYGEAIGIDVSDDAIEFSARRKHKVIKNDVTNIKFRSESFDAVSSLGVFYHKAVINDADGFREMFRVLKQDGRLFFFDSAMPCLYGNHDRAFHGVRRYSIDSLRNALLSAGFMIETITYVNLALFPFVYLKRKLEQYYPDLIPRSEVNDIGWIPNEILKIINLLELICLRHSSQHYFGMNIMAIGKKMPR